MTEDIMDQMRRWQRSTMNAAQIMDSAVALGRMVNGTPPAMPFGDCLVWSICRANHITNELTRYPNVAI